MIVVSNTSPITNLAAIDQFEILNNLFAEIHVPMAVVDELHAKGISWPGDKKVAESSWVKSHSVKNLFLIQALRQDLDKGESERISLAMEIQADYILLDEKEGRHVAQRMGLRPLGVIGILLLAKNKGLLKKVKPKLNLLKSKANFYINESLFNFILKAANE